MRSIQECGPGECVYCNHCPPSPSGIGIARHLMLRETEIIGSTHPFDCLFCERRHECEDPRSHAILHDSMKGIDEDIERIRDHPDVEARTRLIEEAEKIRQATAEFGASPPSYLFVMGIK